jgi:hypothetical protein
LRRLRHIRQGFQPLVAAGVLDDGVDHLERTKNGWLCGILYRKMSDPASRETLRGFIMPVARSFQDLVSSRYRMLTVCFVPEDKPFVERLAASLDEQSFDLWYERREIRPGDSLAEALSGRMSEATHVVPVISKRSTKALWIHHELSPAFIARLAAQNLPIIPLLIDGSTLPPQLAPLSHADFQTSYQNGFGELMTLAGGVSARTA